MLRNTEPVLKLTQANLVREQKVQARLDNLVREVDIHTKRSTIIKTECVKLEKEKDYLYDQVYDLKGAILDLNSKMTSLNEEIVLKRQNLAELEEKSVKINASLFNREESIKIRETELFTLEEEYRKRVSDLRKDSEKLDEKKVLVDRAHRAFAEAMKTVLWN